ncbi:hypothetical protein [Nonomuraea sp. NPDC050202]|jgi:hypothetical protein|uniref:hypothetical protein n=1 Tax=Nonomuraea sp. NPDC050202 TaxID=3155035 RepID=UPI003406A871
MSLFNLGHRKCDPYQDVRNSLGTHMAPSGEPCSQYRNPDTGEIEHVIDRVVDGIEIEARAIGECPELTTPTPDVSSLEATY